MVISLDIVRNHLMAIFAYLLQGLSLGLAATASPGSFQAFIIAQSIRSGWKRILPASLAPLLSDGPIIALVLLILSNLPEDFVRAIRIAGGLFIIFLAYQSFRAFRRFCEDNAEHPEAGRKSLWQAALMNFLNPGPYLFWSLIGGPVLLNSWRQDHGFAGAFLLGFYTAMIGGNVLLIIVFGSARALGPRVSRTLLGISALAMLGFGLYQLWQGFVV
jgi:threonine/homoserine/homoserine lactone efflux protein